MHQGSVSCFWWSTARLGSNSNPMFFYWHLLVSGVFDTTTVGIELISQNPSPSLVTWQQPCPGELWNMTGWWLAEVASLGLIRRPQAETWQQPPPPSSTCPLGGPNKSITTNHAPSNFFITRALGSAAPQPSYWSIAASRSPIGRQRPLCAAGCRGVLLSWWSSTWGAGGRASLLAGGSLGRRFDNDGAGFG